VTGAVVNGVRVDAGPGGHRRRQRRRVREIVLYVVIGALAAGGATFATSGLWRDSPVRFDGLTWLGKGDGQITGVDPETGELDWTPGSSDLGSHPVTARVTDAGGLFDEKSFSIEVMQETVLAGSNQPPQLTVPPNQQIVSGNLLSISASATDPDAGDSLVFSLITAPGGMDINPGSGAISWTPAEAQVGAHDVTVKVTDSAGAFAGGCLPNRDADCIGPPSIVTIACRQPRRRQRKWPLRAGKFIDALCAAWQ